MAAARKAFSTESSLKGPPAMEVLDEAVSLLRQTPLSTLTIYYLGAFPFCLALVYFYFDMTQSADAEAHLPGQALLLTVLYFWMKTCQAVFARKLLAQMEGEDPEPWNAQRWLNTAMLQIIYAGSFVIVYPVALLITIPFGWVNAFYHNISIVATGPQSTVRSSLKEALELSRLWPKQNHLIMGIMLAGVLVLFINLAVFFSQVPELLNMLFGIQTVFDESGSAWNNSSFYLDVLVFCFLILNPLNKAVYALRCFYGRSRLSGADLRAELKRQSATRAERTAIRLATMVVLVSMSFVATPVMADDNATPAPPPAVASPAVNPPPSTAKLDQAIQKTLQKDEFAWRLPREQVADTGDEGFIQRFLHRMWKAIQRGLDYLLKPIGKFLKWLFDHDRNSHSSSPDLSALSAIPWRLIFFAVLAIVVACLVWLLVAHFRNRERLATPALATVPVRTVDLEAEDVRADDLPEDSWLAMAQQMIERGELRLALRALYLATLSVLARQELVRLGPAKSNRDYLVELTRRLRGNAATVQHFRENINLFEASWYGTHAVTEPIIEAMRANHQQVREYAAT